MINKTRLGIPFFDERFGGVYRNRPVLCVGKQGTGKTLAALQFLMQSLAEGERGLMLTTQRASDLSIIAESMQFPITKAIHDGKIFLMEYNNLLPDSDQDMGSTIPSSGFMEFQKIVEINHIQRVVIDTVLPWVAIREEEKLSRHVFSFIQALERMDITSFLTLPKPASALAFALKNRLEHLIPVVFMLDIDAEKRHLLTLTKYLGDSKLPPPIPITISPAHGIVPILSSGPMQTQQVVGQPAAAPQAPRIAYAGVIPTASAARPAAPAVDAAKKKISFSSAIPRPPSEG